LRQPETLLLLQTLVFAILFNPLYLLLYCSLATFFSRQNMHEKNNFNILTSFIHVLCNTTSVT